MQVIVGLSPAHLELLHVVIYNFFVEFRRELKPVGVDTTQPLQPFPDGNGHILLLQLVVIEDNELGILIYIYW